MEKNFIVLIFFFNSTIAMEVDGGDVFASEKEDDLYRTVAERIVEIDTAHKLGSDMFTKVSKDTVRCGVCTKKLRDSSQYDHRNRHLGLRRFECDRCKLAFFQSSNCRSHKAGPEHSASKKDKKYKCNICGSGYCISINLDAHKRRHLDAAIRKNVLGIDSMMNSRDGK